MLSCRTLPLDVPDDRPPAKPALAVAGLAIGSKNEKAGTIRWRGKREKTRNYFDLQVKNYDKIRFSKKSNFIYLTKYII